MGYIIEEIYEVLHWPDTSLHDKTIPNSGLFTKYVNTFLKLKQQSSGFPSNISGEEEKNQYIRMYYENEGILLNKELIKNKEAILLYAELFLGHHDGSCHGLW